MAAHCIICIALAQLPFSLPHRLPGIAKLTHFVGIALLLIGLAKPTLPQLLQKLVEPIAQALLVLTQVSHLTLPLSLLTALTTLFVVVILYAVGGPGIHGFAFCMVLGVIIGTYSTIYIASPMLLWLMNRESNRTRRSASAQQPKATTTAG